MRYSIRLSYDGSAFCGWQIQNNAVSVQGTIESALSTLLGQAIQITGAGRTDTSVNAINYIAHFEIPAGMSFEPEQLRYKLNAMLPRQIVIHEICEVSDDFHARFDAQSREYCYFVHFVKDPFSEKFSYRMRYPLDINAMNEAAAYLIGEHDFSCFEKVGGNNTTSICTITQASWSTYRPNHVELMGAPYTEGDYIVFRIRANRFLRNMVRAIVGSLIEVGRGKKQPSWIQELISSGSRSDAGQSVPGNALFFCRAEY
jgi:tRNA pseudouridine38-40 synthase